MSSNEETLSEKPKGVDADSFPGPIKPTSTSYVSSGLSNDDPHSKKAKSEASVSSGLTKPSGKTGVTSGLSIGVPNSKNPDCTKTGVSLGVRGKAAVSSGAKGKAFVSAKAVEVMSFKDVKFGPHGGELRFRLIHFWEARNVVTKMLIGLEMLLIDQEESVIQGFIPYGRIETYLPHMKAGCTYRFNKFFGSKSKTIYRVAYPDVTISFSWNFALTSLEESSIRFPEDRIRIHGFREFDAASDLRGDLYDYIGHIKLVNGKVPSDGLLLDEAEIAVSRRVELHVQTHDDPVMKLYLWDKAAFEFSEKFKASGGTARVILVTTLNPKRFGGVLSLSAMASSRVFVDSDVQETLFYLSWLNSNLDVASRVNAEVITKPEPATLGELFSYMNQTSFKQESVIQGFIPYGRIETYLPHMKSGYVTISFSWNSALTALEDSSIRFPEDRIRIHGFREFDAASDLRGDLYDYIGHIKLVNGKVPSDGLLLDEAEIAVSRRVELPVQTHDDPVMKLHLWDKAAFEFSEKFKASGGTARVILVTTLKPKRCHVSICHGVLTCFVDSDVQETLFYLSWLNSNLDVASRVNAEVITKPEPATLGELFSYMNQTSFKVAWFECTATIDDVVHGSGWYYIGCGVCHTKATKGRKGEGVSPDVVSVGAIDEYIATEIEKVDGGSCHRHLRS
ncbi:hypothetical protein F2Q70_00039678 [Brassica cretica]|uniref:Uncharacterized protein n=1 Tax=Brassica cretica TaxID=69181 RepID=A0A8S9K370_BRACR|nr:hypothetical protein F2Q70_00039678 [Brassica cretica]